MEISKQVEKNQIRRQMKQLLENLSLNDYQTENLKIQSRFRQLDIVKNSKMMLIYYAINREVATIPLITEWWSKGKEVTLPICLPERNLKAAVVDDLDDLAPGIFGIREPKPSAKEVMPQDLDLIIVPGLAFAKNGYRLGHGAGYYDRFLVNTGAYKLGLAYDFQILEKLPIEPHDQPLDGILTPSHYLTFC